MDDRPRRTLPPEQWVQHVSVVLLVLGVLVAAWGVVYALNGMTQAPATVKVAVEPVREQPAGSEAGEAVEIDGLDPGDSWFTTTDDGLLLAAWDSTRAEQLLNRGDGLVSGLVVLGGVLALRPVLRSITHGRPFEPGNSRRLSLVALAVAIMPAASLPPVVASALVIERTGLADALQPSGGLDATPLLVAAVVMAVAAAFRSGERMTRDLDGLV